VHKHERPQLEARGDVDDPRQDHPIALSPAVTTRPKADEPPEGVSPLAAVMQELADILPGLKLALEHCARAKPTVECLTYRIDQVADSLGMSRRAIERERAAGRFPAPDLHIGKAPLWRPETIRDWLDSRKGGNR
jgi:predicted DNA-binding transcriptional regulator AlpA